MKQGFWCESRLAVRVVSPGDSCRTSGCRTSGLLECVRLAVGAILLGGLEAAALGGTCPHQAILLM